MRSETEGTVPEEQKVDSPDDTAVSSTSSADADADAPADSASAEGPDEPAEESEGKKKKKKESSFWKELPVLIGVALVLALVIKGFVVQAFYIPSASMENTLQIGDRVLVNKLVYHTRDITRGDIVVFNGIDSWDPEVAYVEPSNPVTKAFRAVGTAFGIVPGEKDYIKRVIGVPGDKVKCCDSTGRITVNGRPLDERSYLYVDPDTKEQNQPSEDKFTITVPEDRLWVMGDHRGVSYDSRGHSADVGGGTIPISHVVGRAFVVVWPLGHTKILSIPGTFDQPGLAAALLPYTPLTAGLLGAIPLTLLHRRLRRLHPPRR
ncbi:MAG: signal peptidase I [Streptosporangiaceae bacterium]